MVVSTQPDARWQGPSSASVALADGVRVTLGVDVDESEGVGVSDGVGDIVALHVGEAVGLDDGVELGEGVAAAPCAQPQARISFGWLRRSPLH